MNTFNKFGFTPLNQNKKEELPSLKEENPLEKPKQKFGFNPVKEEIKEPEENLFSSSIRRVSGNMARGLESLLGIPGEFQSMAESITKPLADYLIPLEESKKGNLKTTLPTSSDLREKTKQLTGNYLEPKGKVEKGFQEASGLMASLLGPMKFRRALGVALGSQATKEGLELFGATPTQQEAGKIGTLLALSMVNPNGVKKFWTSLYEKRDALTPQGTIVNGNILKKEAENVIKEIKKGTVAPSEAKVLDQAEKIVKKVKNGKVDLNEMVATKRSLNEIAGDPEMFKRGQHLFPKLQKAVSETLALNPNKEAVKLGKMADEAFGGFLQSKKATNFIKKIVGDKPFKSVALSAGIEALAGHPEAIIPTVVGASVVATGVKGYELLARINANPTLRKYYFDVLKNAAKEDAIATAKSLHKLDIEMSKKEKSKGRKG
jgi:hypothetical protein